jgi:hypothetical protein
MTDDPLVAFGGLTFAFLSGTFLAAYATHYSDPQVGPTAALVFCVVTAVASLGMTYVPDYSVSVDVERRGSR